MVRLVLPRGFPSSIMARTSAESWMAPTFSLWQMWCVADWASASKTHRLHHLAATVLFQFGDILIQPESGFCTHGGYVDCGGLKQPLTSFLSLPPGNKSTEDE